MKNTEQGSTSNGGQRSSLNSGFHSSLGWPIRSPKSISINTIKIMSTRSFINIAILIIVGASSSLAKSPCWKSMGPQAASGATTFGSTEQGNKLKALAQADSTCQFIGIVWTIDLSKRGGHGTQYSLLLWDAKAKSLVRLHVHKEVGVRWESWSSVTLESIMSEDMSDGFDFPGYTTGNGKAPLSPEAVKFVKEQKPEAGLLPGI